jgi:DNA-binding NarL/FixJ family response regulator
MQPGSKLTERQRQVLAPLLRGEGERRVAHLLNISVPTVHTHVRRIYAHFGVHSRAELIYRILAGNGIPDVDRSEIAGSP